MLINEKDAIERLASPLNLMNRLRATNGNSKRSSAMNLFVASRQDDNKEVNNKEIIKQDNNKENNKELPLTKPSFQVHNPFDARKAEIGEHENTAAVDKAESSSQALVQVDKLIDNADAQIKLAQAHDLALDTLTRSVQMLGTKLDDIKADKLPSVISATSKVVEGIRRERNEASKARLGNRDVHLHFYTPIQKQESEYEIVEVG